jgi:putative FmdB family regulatory protein
MPTYEYECKTCGHNFEVFHAMSDPPVQNCPECGKEVRRLILGGAGVIFKGSGFYVTDKNKESGKSKPAVAAAEPAKGDSAKTDAAAKPETAQAAAQPAAQKTEALKQGSEVGVPKAAPSAEKAKPESKDSSRSKTE